MSSNPSYRRSFNRWELKYVVPVDRIEALEDSLGPYIRPDAHADEDRGYQNCSVYYDSPDLCFFWEKIEGLKFRRKLRIRRYGSEGPVFVEIKQRSGRTVQKRRIRMSVDRLRETFLAERLDLLDAEAEDDPVLAEILLLYRTYDLRPTLTTWYRRRALEGTEDPGLRITFDINCSYSVESLDVTRPIQGLHPLMDPRLAVMEVKFDDRAPRWVTTVLAQHDLKMMRISKYCRGVDLARFDGAMT